MQIKSTRDARAGKPYDTQLINIDIKYVKTSLGRRVSDSAATSSQGFDLVGAGEGVLIGWFRSC